MKSNTPLKFARMDAGLTQEELAGALGVSPITVYRWERGETIPHLYFRRRLSKLLHLSEQELGFLETDEEETPPQKHNPFLTDPCIPLHTMIPLGQQALCQEMGASRHRVLGLVGLPGSGKTMVAQTLVAQPEFRRKVEGIFWVTAGPEFRPLRHLQRWLMLLGKEAVPEQLEEAQDLLRVALGERHILVVIDDLCQAEDMRPYQIGSAWHYLITTRLPIVANTLCDVVYHPRQLTASQAFHVLSHGLPTSFVREHRQVLQALCHQVAHLPGALEQIGAYLRVEARAHSQRRFHDALTSLFQPNAYLHLPLPSAADSLAAHIKHMAGRLSPSAQHALTVFAAHCPPAPATFTEQQATELLQAHTLQLHELDQLVDGGLVTAIGRNRYQLHPVIAAYARLEVESAHQVSKP